MEFYIDVETTSPHPYTAHVVEIAAVAIGEGGTEIAHFDTLVNPGAAALLGADSGAMAVHRIPVSDIEAAPSTEEAARGLAAFFKAHDGALHAFNNQFEAGILTRPPWAVEPARWGECVMLAASRVMGAAGALKKRRSGDLKWPTLDEAVTYFSVSSAAGRHRALEDARIAARVHAAILCEEDRLSDEARLLFEDIF